MPINNPKEVLALVERAASDKISLPVRKILILAFLAGAYISMGGLFSIVIGYGFPSMAPAPGLQRLLSGLVFPLGLMLVVFAGAELFTGNNAVLIPGALGRRYGWRKVLLNWMLVYAGNFVGSNLRKIHIFVCSYWTGSCTKLFFFCIFLICIHIAMIAIIKAIESATGILAHTPFVPR